MSGTVARAASPVVGPRDDPGSSSGMTWDRSRARGHTGNRTSDCRRCRRARPHLPALIAGAALVEFQFELVLLVPANTPYRAVAALLLCVIAGGLAAGRRHPLAGILAVAGAVALLPALSPAYYEHMAGPYAAGLIAAYRLGAYGGRWSLALGLA